MRRRLGGGGAVMAKRVDIIGVALLSLLAFTTAAYAECAWVLWQETEIRSYGTNAKASQWWELDGAHGSRKECETNQDKTWNAEVTKWPADPSSIHHIETPLCQGDRCSEVRTTWWSFQVTEVHKDRPNYLTLTFKPGADRQSGYLRRRFVCLPDTIDPRGPKGK